MCIVIKEFEINGVPTLCLTLCLFEYRCRLGILPFVNDGGATDRYLFSEPFTAMFHGEFLKVTVTFFFFFFIPTQA